MSRHDIPYCITLFTLDYIKRGSGANTYTFKIMFRNTANIIVDLLKDLKYNEYEFDLVILPLKIYLNATTYPSGRFYKNHVFSSVTIHSIDDKSMIITSKWNSERLAKTKNEVFQYALNKFIPYGDNRIDSKCLSCNGAGIIEDDTIRQCYRCFGFGSVEWMNNIIK